MEEHCILFRDALECAAEQRCCWLSSFSESFRVDIQGLLSSATLILWKSEKHLKITAICTNLYSTYLVPITKTIIFNLTKLEIIYISKLTNEEDQIGNLMDRLKIPTEKNFLWFRGTEFKTWLKKIAAWITKPNPRMTIFWCYV